MTKAVAYYRVSTARQGASGLGLEAQRAAVKARLNGGPWTLLGEFTEVETGKRSERPQLLAGRNGAADIQGQQPFVGPLALRPQQRARKGRGGVEIEVAPRPQRGAIALDGFVDHHQQDVVAALAPVRLLEHHGQWQPGVVDEKQLPLVGDRAHAWAIGDPAVLQADLTWTSRENCTGTAISASSLHGRIEVLQEQGREYWRGMVSYALLNKKSTVTALPIRVLLGPDNLLDYLRSSGHLVESPH